MSGINWKRKLTSRKFWVAVVGFVTPLMAMFNVSDNTAVQVTALIMSGGTLIAYIIGEGITDSANVGGTLEEIQPIQSAIGFDISRED